VTTYDLANLLAFAVLLVASFRARWAAVALLPPCLLILARMAGLVDISSASHPLRWIVPVASLGVAALGAYAHIRRIQYIRSPEFVKHGFAVWRERERFIPDQYRGLISCILIFASGCTDIPALFAWQLPGEWIIVPLQIAVCVTILGVLLAPERWVSRWLR
jgi:hypothetical protein